MALIPISPIIISNINVTIITATQLLETIVILYENQNYCHQE